jgi:thymidylate synthase
MHIVARSLPDSWWGALWKIFDQGTIYSVDRGSYQGQKRLEFPFFSMEVTHPGNRPLIPEIPHSLGIPNPTDMDYVNRYLSEYICGSSRAVNEQYTYGERINISYPKIIQMLKETPNTNHAVIEVATPLDIYHSDPPCLRLIDLKIRNGKLNMALYFRSWDLWSGFPANLAALQLWKEGVAIELEVEDGKLFAASSGLHLYDHCWEIAKKRIYRR